MSLLLLFQGSRTVTFAASAQTTVQAQSQLLKVKLFVAQAQTVMLAAARRQTQLVRGAPTVVFAFSSRLVRLVRSAVSTLSAAIFVNASPAIVHVTAAPATYVRVVAGPQ